jgi:hypothetical protein
MIGCGTQRLRLLVEAFKRLNRLIRPGNWLGCRRMNLKPEGEMLAVMYVFGISVVAAILFVAVDNIEPNRRMLWCSSSSSSL